MSDPDAHRPSLPVTGGVYLRDPATGALVPADAPVPGNTSPGAPDDPASAPETDPAAPAARTRKGR